MAPKRFTCTKQACYRTSKDQLRKVKSALEIKILSERERKSEKADEEMQIEAKSVLRYTIVAENRLSAANH